jgi:hypothetical protein
VLYSDKRALFSLPSLFFLLFGLFWPPSLSLFNQRQKIFFLRFVCAQEDVWRYCAHEIMIIIKKKQKNIGNKECFLSAWCWGRRGYSGTGSTGIF